MRVGIKSPSTLANIVSKLLPMQIEAKIQHGVDLSKYSKDELVMFQRLMLKGQVPLLDDRSGPVVDGEIIDDALSAENEEYLRRKTAVMADIDVEEKPAATAGSER